MSIPGLVNSALQFEETGNPFALRRVALAMRLERLDIAELSILREYIFGKPVPTGQGSVSPTGSASVKVM
jgi:hypothetical protein